MKEGGWDKCVSSFFFSSRVYNVGRWDGEKEEAAPCCQTTSASKDGHLITS